MAEFTYKTSWSARGASAVGVVLLHVSLALAAPSLTVKTDHPDAIYRTGEPVKFVVSVTDGGKPVAGREVKYVVTKNGEIPVSSGSIMSGDGPVDVQASLGEPGFLKIAVQFPGDNPTKFEVIAAGAAVEPEKIQPSLPVPEDFDAYWAKQRALLVAHPLEVKQTDVKSPEEGVVAFDIQIAAIPDQPVATNVSCYFAKPTDAKPKSCPAILYTQGAGFRSSLLDHAASGAKKFGAICIDLNAHGLPNDKPRAFYMKMQNDDLKNYGRTGMDDRDKNYFRGMYLREWRALDFLTQQPVWDGHILIVEGSSQGGGQALAIGGLDHRITLCLASVPALNDLTGAVVGRTPGWPKMLKPNDDGSIDEKAKQELRYIDAMNFASRIQCPVQMSVGFIDTTVPPATVYCAFNNVPVVDKTIVNQVTRGHGFPQPLIDAWDEVVRKHIVEKRAEKSEDL